MQTQGDPETNVREQWERRAERSGTRLSGVLFKGLSDRANAAMHAWHEWVVSEAFLQRLPEGARVLDLGCGYGRLSKTVMATRPDVAIVGQDMSHAYCGLFREHVGECVCASAEMLPFESGSFDGVMAITCLMYGVREVVPDILLGIRRVIRPGGVLLLLDPGRELQRLVAGLRGARNRSLTGGTGFSRSEYPRLVAGAGFQTAAMGGNPWLSTTLLTPGVAHSTSSFVEQALDWSVRHDCRESGFSRLALHRWIAAIRKD